jgi:hypothetical protein
MTTLTRPQATDYLDGAGVELDLVLGEYADLIEATESGLSTHDHNGGDGGQIAYANLSGLPTLGTAAALDVGTTANKILQLDATAKLPAVDGSQLTNLPSVVGDHGALSGLADDDHAQYHTDARGDARYSVLAHNHAGTYEASGAVTTHASLTSAVHGITAFGASLVDDANAADARTTLGLGGAASLNVGTVAGTVAAGDDARIVAAAPETASTIGTLIAGSTDKATPVDADSIAISDSAAAGILKRLSWANVKAGLNSFYAKLAGAAGGQTLIGGTGAGENLTLLSTSNATKGAVIFGTASEYDHVNDRIGIGTLTPAAKIHALSTTEQLRLGFDASNFASTTVSATGLVTIAGTLGQYSFAGPTDAQATATLGSELVTNPSFASDLSGWTAGAGWSWAAGGALHTAGNTATLAQDESVTSGSTYQLDIVISGRTAGSIAIDLGAVSVIESGTASAFTSTISRTVVSGATGTVSLAITPTTDFNGTIDSVSLKLVTLGSFPAAMKFTEGGSAGIEIRQSLARGNISIGSNAGFSITTATRNSNFGAESGRSITTGSSNSNIGSYAGSSITTGSFNNNFGRDAGRNITTGTNNSNIGSYAGLSVTTGTNNNNFGRDAGRNITTGTNNSNIGSYAGLSVTTGTNNNNFGIESGRNITTGSSNSNIGSYAGRAITTGTNNSNFGAESGRNITTGSSNSSFGASSGRYLADGSTLLITPSNCAFFGALTKASADGVTAENVFGYNATGIGSNTTCIGASSNTKTQIYGDIILDKTVTATGTTGAQTINKTVGSVNFAAAASSLVVTNSRVTTASVIVATVATDDATMKSVVAVSAAGSFTLTANAAATAETRVNFIVIN